MKRAASGSAQIPENLISWAKGLDEAIFAKWLPSFAKSMGLPEDDLRTLFGRDADTAKAPPRATTVASAKGLTGEALEKLQEDMGTLKATAPKLPYQDANGNFVTPCTPPTEARRLLAAKRERAASAEAEREEGLRAGLANTVDEKRAAIAKRDRLAKLNRQVLSSTSKSGPGTG